jgi:diguanylate cyclase
MKDELIELDLRGDSKRPSDAQKALIDQLLTLLKDSLLDQASAAESSGLGIDEFRSTLASSKDAAAILAVGTKCLTACREAVSRLGTERLERQQQVRALLDLMRDALSSVASGSDTLQADLAKTADRFQALATIDDPRVLRSRLAAEVVSLKNLANECKQAWQGTLSQLDERVTVLEAQLQTITTEASIDPLTGIANRRTFERTCRSWMASGSAQFVLAILDLDNFKPINDTLGHPAGDRLLTSIARTLAAAVRPEDLVARLGGDEFVILAAHLTLRTAQARFTKILSSFNAPDESTAKSPITVTLSCGVAEYSAGDTLESMLKRADDALYDAKRQGKHRVMTKDVPFMRDLLKRRG